MKRKYTIEDWSQVTGDKTSAISAINQAYVNAIKQIKADYDGNELQVRRVRDAVLVKHGDKTPQAKEAELEYRKQYKAIYLQYLNARNEAERQRGIALKSIGVMYREVEREIGNYGNPSDW